MDRPRTLQLSGLDEVMPEVDLLIQGHKTLGDWSLAQICNHLSGAILSSVEGARFRFPWFVRKTIGPIFFRQILKTGQFPRGIKLPEAYQPKAGLDARAEAEALRATIRLFRSHDGPLADHPLAGPIARRSWERFHSIHCAHHLAFVLPDSPTLQ